VVRPQGGWLVMEDLIYLALIVAFFLLAIAYVRGCEKL
jgi:hypothetical protein